MRIIFLILFLFASCQNNNARNISHLSLEDNESMIYENYMKQNQGTVQVEEQKQQEDEKHLSNYSQFLHEYNDANCVYNCAVSPIKIGILPMSFSNQTSLDEITSTVAFFSSNINHQQYHTIILKNDDLPTLSLLDLDIIVGPFKDEDIKTLEEILRKQKMEIPVISLTTKITSPNPNIYYFGYSNDDIIKSTIEHTTKAGLENYGILMPNNAIGSATYNLFKKHISNSGKNVARVEFYDESSMENIQKFVEKVEMSVNQKYFVSNDGKTIEDTHSFSKNIKEQDEKTVTLKDGTKYAKKYKKMDALIIDGNVENFEIIFDALLQRKALENVVIIGSPRTGDSIISMASKEKYAEISRSIIFPANYEFYKSFYVSYAQQFGKTPTKIGTTLYETLVYIVTLHKKHDITKGLNFAKVPEFAGLNGNMAVLQGSKSIVRFANMCEFKNGAVSQIETE